MGWRDVISKVDEEIKVLDEIEIKNEDDYLNYLRILQDIFILLNVARKTAEKEGEKDLAMQEITKIIGSLNKYIDEMNRYKGW